MKDIKHNEMVKALAKGGEDIIAKLTPQSMHLLHMSVGMCGEASELLEAIHDRSDYNSVNRDNIIEELGDFEFYTEGLRQGLNVKREYVRSIGDFNYTSLRPFPFLYMKDMTIDLTMLSGIILDQVKKVAMYCKTIDKDAVSKNLFEIEVCLEGIRDSFFVSHEDVIQGNTNKLGKRYEGFNYSDKQARDRADKSE